MQHPPESMGGSLNSANAIWLDIRLTAIAAAPAAAMLCQEGRWATQSTDTHSLWCVSHRCDSIAPSARSQQQPPDSTVMQFPTHQSTQPRDDPCG